MIRFRSFILPIAASLLVLAGCNRQQPQPAAPQSGPAAAATPKAAGPAVAEQEIQVKSVGRNAQIVHVVKPGTVVLWTSPMQFYIHFIQGNDFCEEPSVPRYRGFYAASKTGPAGAEYRLQCTVKHDIPASSEFTYEIFGTLPPKPPREGLQLRTTPCGGCNEGTPPPNSGN